MFNAEDEMPNGTEQGKLHGKVLWTDEDRFVLSFLILY